MLRQSFLSEDMNLWIRIMNFKCNVLFYMRNTWNLEWDWFNTDHGLSHNIQTQRTRRLVKNSCGFHSWSDYRLQTHKHTQSCRGLIPDVTNNKRLTGMHFVWDNICWLFRIFQKSTSTMKYCPYFIVYQKHIQTFSTWYNVPFEKKHRNIKYDWIK